ncbi:MAG: c-type cytochrome [Magnetococcus sp. DMHC-8]
MKNFLQVAIFSILVIIGFAGYSSFGIPQIKPAPPPQPEKVDLGAMTMEGFVALGEKIFSTKGTCTLCHNSLGRAPMLDKLGENLPKRLADPRYKGTAKNAQEYLLESLVKPSAYVVTGFGKAGSNDMESPMPDVSGGSIGLTDVETKAVLAYMLDSNGMENTVEIPKDAGKSAAAAPAKGGESGAPRKPYATVEEILAANTCGACHKIGKEVGELGPDLTNVGTTRSRAYLRQALLDPNADIAAGYAPDMMPANLGEVLYAKELEMLVDYLVAQRASDAPPAQDGAKQGNNP